MSQAYIKNHKLCNCSSLERDVLMSLFATIVTR